MATEIKMANGSIWCVTENCDVWQIGETLCYRTWDDEECDWNDWEPLFMV